MSYTFVAPTEKESYFTIQEEVYAIKSLTDRLTDSTVIESPLAHSHMYQEQLQVLRSKIQEKLK